MNACTIAVAVCAITVSTIHYREGATWVVLAGN